MWNTLRHHLTPRVWAIIIDGTSYTPLSLGLVCYAAIAGWYIQPTAAIWCEPFWPLQSHLKLSSMIIALSCHRALAHAVPSTWKAFSWFFCSHTLSLSINNSFLEILLLTPSKVGFPAHCTLFQFLVYVFCETWNASLELYFFSPAVSLTPLLFLSASFFVLQAWWWQGLSLEISLICSCAPGAELTAWT